MLLAFGPALSLIACGEEQDNFKIETEVEDSAETESEVEDSVVEAEDSLEEGEYSTLFYLSENGVTVMCPEAGVADFGEVNGILYTKRDRSRLDQLILNEDWGEIDTNCVSGVRDMSSLFLGEDSFNRDISSWDVSKVKFMNWMFYRAYDFTGDISGWDVISLTYRYDYLAEEHRFGIG